MSQVHFLKTSYINCLLGCLGPNRLPWPWVSCSSFLPSGRLDSAQRDTHLIKSLEHCLHIGRHLHFSLEEPDRRRCHYLTLAKLLDLGVISFRVACVSPSRTSPGAQRAKRHSCTSVLMAVRGSRRPKIAPTSKDMGAEIITSVAP